MKNPSQKLLMEAIGEIVDERYVHSLSELIYNSISTLWHVSEKSERELSGIASKVVCGVFCLKYLSHVEAVIRKRLGIEGIRDRDLSRGEPLARLKKRLRGEVEVRALVEEIIPRLKGFVESINPGDLEGVTRMAHTGDYLLSSLEDLRSAGDGDYELWLLSIPHYYEKDLERPVSTRPAEFIREIEEYADSTWHGQVPIEALSLNTRTPNSRINLSTLLTTDGLSFERASSRTGRRPSLGKRRG